MFCIGFYALSSISGCAKMFKSTFFSVKPSLRAASCRMSVHTSSTDCDSDPSAQFAVSASSYVRSFRRLAVLVPSLGHCSSIGAELIDIIHNTAVLCVRRIHAMKLRMDGGTKLTASVRLLSSGRSKMS